jgi:hypothetical protein
LAVTASPVRESAFASLHARFRLTWTRYAPLLAPPISEIQLLHSRFPTTYSRLVSGRPNSGSPKVIPDLFTQGFTSDPLGPVAFMPSGSLRSTTTPISTAPCLMALLPVDDLRGPVCSASLRPLCLSSRFRPPIPRVNTPALCHCASVRGGPGRHGHPRRVL